MATAIAATATTPPTALVASAPLVLEAPAAELVWAAPAAGVTLDVVIPLAPVAVALVPAPPEAAGEAVPPIGAVDCPSIWACTDALNVPDMPVMLNLAENARAGYCGFVVSLRLRDWNRMKLEKK